MKTKKKSKIVNKKNKIINKKLPLTKSLGDLMKDEDGFVSKETILKVGLSTVAALGAAGALVDNTASAYVWNTASHNNAFVTHPPAAGAPECVTHTNVTTHTSY